MSDSVDTPQRLNLFYVDGLPGDIKFNKIEDILDKYDHDVIQSILEKPDIEEVLGKLIYIKHNINIKYINIENAYEITYAHALILLNKFPQAEINLFLTEHSKDLLELKAPSIIDTHFNLLTIEDWRIDQPTTSKKRKFEEISEVNAKDLLEEFKKEMESFDNFQDSPYI